MFRRLVLPISLIYLFLLGRAGADDHSAPALTAIKVLIVGNSYTKRFDVSLAGVVSRLTENAPVRIVAQSHYISNATLDGHLNAGVGRKIGKGRYDMVLLQDYSTRPITDFEKTRDSLSKFATELRESNAKGILFLPWARRKSPETLVELDKALARLGQEFDMPIAPFGRAWKRALEMQPDLDLYERDGAHPTPAGMYLNACVLYAQLAARSPEGLGNAGLSGIDEATCHSLQSVAWSVVCNSEKLATAIEEKQP